MAQLRLLGPVELSAPNSLVDLGPPKQRVLLAALAVDAGRPVMSSVLIDRIWDEAPPVDARKALHTYVTRVRQVLLRARQPDDPPVPLVRRSGGYQLDMDVEHIDLHRFRRLIEQARAIVGGDPQRGALLL